MPKKEKGAKGGKKAKVKIMTVIDGKSTENMTKEELEGHVLRLREELDREREERNYFQLERDKVNTFFEIAKRRLEELSADLRNKDTEMENAEERHQVEIKVYKQKVKHMLYEQQNNLVDIKSENAVQMKLALEENRSNELVLRKDKRSLKVELKEQQLAHEDNVKSLNLAHDEFVTDLRAEFERKQKELENRYENKLKILRDDLELRRKTEVHEIEERKNTQINTLMKNHEKAFADIKNYYNDITLNNLALINTLKEQIDEMRKREIAMEKQVHEVTGENKRLLEPLQMAKDNLSDLTKKMENFTKVQNSLAISRTRLKKTQQNLYDTKWENELLEQRFAQLKSEKEDLYKSFVAGINEVFQKSSLKNLVIEKKLLTIEDALEKKESQLNEILAASNIDPAALMIVTRKLEDVLDAKNCAIKDLQYELTRVCKSHNDLLRAYESRLRQFGIPIDDTGFQPFETHIRGQQMGQGPAGLVSAPK